MLYELCLRNMDIFVVVVVVVVAKLAAAAMPMYDLDYYLLWLK